MRTIYSAFVLILSFIIGAAACAAPDTADAPEPEPVTDSVPPVEAEASSGGTSCTLSSTCWSGGIQGHCAKSPSNGASMCCTGCVDAYGYCRPGDSANVCGGGGQSCSDCADGFSCVSAACASSCVEPGSPCMDINGNAGKYGNGSDGSCVCCTGCFDEVTGHCQPGGYDDACGAGGSLCVDCPLFNHCNAGACTL